jgi:beta-galactosidase
VFADCDEVAIYINGKEIERKSKTENGVYKFNVKYEKGTILAIAYTNGKEIGRSFIETEGEASTVLLVREKSYTNTDIVYVDAFVSDESGKICTQEQREITFKIEGGKILASAGGGLTDTIIYTDNKCTTYKGRGLVIIQKTDKVATLYAECEGLKGTKIQL